MPSRTTGSDSVPENQKTIQTPDDKIVKDWSLKPKKRE
jgi:hypothetical protein